MRHSPVSTWRRARRLAAALILGQAAALAQADEGGAIQVNGFINAGLARSSFDDARYKYIPTADADIGTAATPRVDTQAGLQLRYVHSDSLNATAQVLLRDPPSDGSPLKLTWAYAGIQLTPQIEVKLGRYMMPFFLFTDTRNVRYAQPWVRPPGEVYALVTNTEFFDGAYLRHLTPLGPWSLATEAFVGANRYETLRASLSGTYYGMAFTLYDSNWTFRVMAQNGTTQLESPAFDRVLALLQQRAPDVAADYAFAESSNTGYLSAGLRYETEDWLLLAEVAETRPGDSRLLASDTGAYLTVGRRFGDWMPFVGYAARRSHNTEADARITDPLASATVANVLAQQNYSQRTVSVGLRWDLVLNLALKLQLDRVQPSNGAKGSFTVPLPAGQTHSDVFSLAAHYIF
ncbi:hypothetical protein OPU71_08995 [Niveibacterium sp. 24ML]|uniref:hypothetical protein n=1 Tax=Niveibacterium sp. 24ML TaxID=2985512 RepID=UPI00226E9EC9|nr:hypothetical protein [Niveibacterium sp. 24ML]MCX9156256.1 hypothetical protein [Niveibacterium sp. 24ML]